MTVWTLTLRNSLLALLLLALSTSITFAQTTEFTYQGKLLDGLMPPTANYDFEFRLFREETNGAAVATQQRLGVPVANGIFNVKLDFGVAFEGLALWLEMAVKPAGGPSFTTLAPRQLVTSAPYAIRSLSAEKSDVATFATNAQTATSATNASQLGGIAASQYVLTTDPRMTDARPPTAGSGNYIQNTINQQSADFNIDGNGTMGGTLSANAVTSATQYNIGGFRVLSIAGSENTFAGVNAGANSTGSRNSFFGNGAGAAVNNTGSSNSFFGERAGAANTTGLGNSFFGASAGGSNTTGRTNALFGVQAGQSNTTGQDNSFFGAQAGFSNQTGNNNAFFGRSAGAANTDHNNSFFGALAGSDNTTGRDNSFFGAFAGDSNTTGYANTFFGTAAGATNTTGRFNAFFGESTGQSNTTGESNAFFGTSAGFFNTTGGVNSFFGEAAGQRNTTGSNNAFFGAFAGQYNTTSNNNTFFGGSAGYGNSTGTNNAFFGYGAGYVNQSGSNNTIIGQSAGLTNTTGSNNTIVGSEADVGAANLTFATAIGAGAIVSNSNTIVLGRSNGSDKVRILGLGAAGSANLCRNTNNEISTCSSSLRYKTGVQTFTRGLDIVRSMRPIAFDWKEGGLRDLGFGAEEVEKIEPLLVFYNQQGQVEGVKYGQITTVLVNAVQQQQRIIERQQKQLEALKKLICLSHSQAQVCR